MKSSRVLKLANGLPVECRAGTLQNAVRRSVCGVARLLPVSSMRTGTIKASGVTLQLKAGLRRSTLRQYLTTRSTTAKYTRLSCRLGVTTKTAPNWSARWDSQGKVASRTQGRKVILRSGQCAETTVNI